MDVEHKERAAASAFNLGHEDGPVKINGLAGRGRFGSHRMVNYWRQVRMPQLAMGKDRRAREDNEVMDVGDSASAGTACRSAMEGLVGRSLEEQIQRMRRPVFFLPGALTIDLLKAEQPASVWTRAALAVALLFLCPSIRTAIEHNVFAHGLETIYILT